MPREARGPSAAAAAPLAAWFKKVARPLPWREVDPATGRRYPYRSLVSEIMLQQTQVSRVAEKFPLFIARFPTVQALAAADIGDVLALWSGMGYYRRAHHLHAAAKHIVARFGGNIPRDVKSLKSLPGIGRYCAGAIASIVFGEPEPIVDGNVTRVLMRLHAKDGPQDSPQTAAWVWEQAAELARAAADNVALCNEGIMELGATVCTPVSPSCAICPLRSSCRAFALGLQEQIPPPKSKSRSTRLWQDVLFARDRSGRILVERRPDQGLWAGLWQCPVIESFAARRPARNWFTDGSCESACGHAPKVALRMKKTLTHRQVQFTVWSLGGPVDPARAKQLIKAPIGAPSAAATAAASRRWVTPAQAAGLGMSNPQREIIARALGGAVSVP